MIIVITFTPLMIWIAASALIATDRIVKKHYALLMTFGWTVEVLVCVLQHRVFWSYFAAIFTAWWLYDWWHSGGGDDTKKRLRKLKRKFQPMRRMAPVTA